MANTRASKTEKMKPCRRCAIYVPIPLLGTGRAYGYCKECAEFLDSVLIGNSIARMAGKED